MLSNHIIVIHYWFLWRNQSEICQQALRIYLLVKQYLFFKKYLLKCIYLEQYSSISLQENQFSSYFDIWP